MPAAASAARGVYQPRRPPASPLFRLVSDHHLILPGSDPKLKTQDVAVGTHNDHVGFTTPVDEDPIKAFNDIRNRLLLANSMNGLGPEMPTTIPVNMDSRRDHDDYA
jgi:hypothetical protein